MPERSKILPELKPEELIKYNRQIIFPSFGEEGQKKLKSSHIIVAGMGGLGSPISIYLACAGVGKLTLVDFDTVELSNLNRQILHWDEDIGEKKVISAARKLRRINPFVEIIPIESRITGMNIRELIRGADIVMDAMDNMGTRLIINEACVKEGIPFIHGGIYGFMGEATTIIPGRTPCLECIYPRGTEVKKPFPVFGATPALIASIQVMEAIKLIGGFGRLLAGRMLYFNGENMEFWITDIERDPKCPVCGGRDG